MLFSATAITMPRWAITAFIQLDWIKSANSQTVWTPLLPTAALNWPEFLGSHTTWHVRLEHMIGLNVYLGLHQHVDIAGEST